MTEPSRPAAPSASITPRATELNRELALPFDARLAARTLLHEARICALATLDPSGHPYNTFTNLLVEADGTPLFWAAGLALHARNIARDARIAMSVADCAAADMMTAHRLTLVGRAESLGPEEMPELGALYARRHPKAKLYLSLPDSRLYRLRVEAMQINGGPARNAQEITPADFAIELSDAADLMGAVPRLIAELETPPLLGRLQARAGRPEGRWRIISIDPEGVTLASTLHNTRLWFEERLTTAQALRAWVAALPEA